MRNSHARRRVQVCVCWFMLVGVGCGSSTDRLIGQLRDGEPELRRAAARALGERRGDAAEVVPALSDAIADADLEVRELAIAALGEMGTAASSALPALERALVAPDISVRLSAALAIQRLAPDHESYVPVLVESLRSGHGTVFIEVGRMGTDAEWAVPELVTLLTHPEPPIRALAAQTLGQIGAAGSETRSALERRLRDAAPAVRRAARRALEQLQTAPDDR